MITRRHFAMSGLALAAAAAIQSNAAAQAPADSGHDHHGALDKCAKACSDCQRECDACATHCAKMLADGKKEHLATLMTCRDCADFCSAAAEIVARGGPFAALICEACATACARCAEACEKFPNDAHMKKCAAECRECEKACREMVSHQKA